jgi:hypothetical protein
MTTQAAEGSITFTPTQVQQQVFTLSWLSNIAGMQQLERKDLQAQLSTYSENIGAWNVVWGPCYTIPSGSQQVANAMFVAQAVEAPQSNYVVAIAGTNKSSFYDWMQEDLDITPTSWPYAVNAGNVTAGDNNGLSNLLAMMGGTQSLQQFLAAIADKSSVSLTFTGHSLGGALSPMLTLALMDPNSTLNTSNDVSIGNWGEVSLLATAGPSIGDATFVQYFQTTLAKASIEFVWNQNDVVPHSWNATTMMELTSPTNIYDLAIANCLAKILAFEQQGAAQNSYVQFEANPAFAAPLSPYSVSPFWTPNSKFVAQAACQHILAYNNAFGCTWLPGTNPCDEPIQADTALAAINLSGLRRGICSTSG